MSITYIRKETVEKINQIYYQSLGNFLGILANDSQFFNGKKTQKELYQELVLYEIARKKEQIKIKNKISKSVQAKRKKRLTQVKYDFKKQKEKLEKNNHKGKIKEQCVALVSKNGLDVHQCSLEREEGDDLCHLHLDSTLPYGYVDEDEDSSDSQSESE